MYSLITMQNLVVVSHTECGHVRSPKNLGDDGARPMMGARLTPWKHATPPHIYHAKFGRSRSNCSGKNFRDAGVTSH